MEPEDIDYGDYDFEDDNEINSNLDINKNPSGFSNDYVIEEDYTTDLHQLIEQDSLLNIIQNDEYSAWNKMFIEFKNKVINLTTATLKYMTNLLNEIENKYVNDINQNLLNE